MRRCLSHRNSGLTRRRWQQAGLILLAGLCLLLSGAAMASCAEPFGNEGDVVYNAEIANLTYCDGTNWNRINDSYGIPTGGLVGHWTFGDGSGTTATDVSGSGHDGTLSNMNPATDWVAGKLGKALDFDGVDDAVGLPDSVTLKPDSITVSLWFDAENPGDRNELYKYGNADYSKGVSLQGSSGTVTWEVGAVSQVNLSDGYDGSTWVHAVGTASNGTMELYVDGILKGTTTYTGSIDWSSTGFRAVGAKKADGESAYAGRIDDVRVYNRALTTDEVQALYEMGNGEPEDPIARWKLDDGSGTTATDNAGVNDGTLQNGPVWTGGKLGAGLRFDPSDDAVEIPSSPRLDISDNITVAAWARLSSDDSKGRKILCNYHCGSSGGSYLTLQIYPDGANFRFKNDGGGVDAVSGNETPLNTWEHIVGTYDGSSLRIYQNGVETGSNLVSSTIATSSNPFLIGNSGQSGGGWGTDSRRNFDGVIDDVRIYDRALSTEEVEDLYQGACTNPIGRSGDLFYDADSDVVRWCGGGIWHAAGPVPGAGGSGCSDPTGVRGDIFYNVDYMVPVYCDGTYWRPMAGTPDIPTDGLVGYWSFDSGSGTTAKDWSENGNDGTLTNMDPSSDWVTGKVGSHALDFDGVDDHVDVPLIFDRQAKLSLSAWVYPRSTAEGMVMMNQWYTCMTFLVDSNIQFQTKHSPSRVGHTLSGGTVLANSWQHIAAVVDGTTGTKQIYLNGEVVASDTGVPLGGVCDGGGGSETNVIGYSVYSNDDFDGLIDDGRVYNRALTANEVKVLYLNGL